MLCIVVHFQPVIKLLQKGVRVHQKRVILMQKNAKCTIFVPDPSPNGEGDTLPHNPPPRRLDLNPPF